MSDQARFRKGFLLGLVIAISAAFFFVIKDFLMTIFVAAIFSGLAHPLYATLRNGFGGREVLASAFTLLGLDSYCAVVPDNLRAREIRHFFADRLMSSLASVETPDWSWFEEGLTYDNARLPQALMLAGMATQTPDYVDAGLRSLRWLMTQQTAPTGHFRPVGTAGFGELRQSPRAFDQQPVEATATIAACLTAWRADGDAEWKTIATNVFAWFLGRNDLSVALVDPETGSCRDGLHPDRANENRGGESVVSYLLGLADIRQLARVNVSVTPPVALRAIGARVVAQETRTL